MSKKSKKTTDAIDWAKPALTQGVAQTQDAFQASQPITQNVSTGLGDVFSSYLSKVNGGSPVMGAANDSVSATARGSYLGQNPSASIYGGLGGNNPAMASLQGLTGARGIGDYSVQANGGTAALGGLLGGYSPQGDYGSIGRNNRGADALSGLVGGYSPQGDYTARNNAANGNLATLGDGGFVGQGAGMDAMKGLLTRGGSPTADYYKRELSGEFLNSNPYAQFLTDDVANDVNSQFSMAGRYGSGAHSGVVARETGKIRAGLYNEDRNRQLQAAGMADSYDLNDRNAVLGAANAYGDNTRADRGQQMQALGLLSQNSAQDADRSLNAAGARDAAGLAGFNSRLGAAGALAGADTASGQLRLGASQAQDAAGMSGFNSRLGAASAYGDSSARDQAMRLQATGAQDAASQAELARQQSALGMQGQQYLAGEGLRLDAGRAADGAYGDERQRMLQAASIAPGLAQGDYAGLGPLLALAQQYQQTPFTGTGAYNQNIGLLSSPYSTTTQKDSGLGNTLGTIAQVGGAVAGAMSGNPMALAGGLGGFTQGWSAGIPSIAQQTGLLSQNPYAGLPSYRI